MLIISISAFLQTSPILFFIIDFINLQRLGIALLVYNSLDLFPSFLPWSLKAWFVFAAFHSFATESNIAHYG